MTLSPDEPLKPTLDVQLGLRRLYRQQSCEARGDDEAQVFIIQSLADMPAVHAAANGSRPRNPPGPIRDPRNYANGPHTSAGAVSK